MPDGDRDLETRDVRVDDPRFPADVNAALTDELQKAVGAKRVQVPRDTPHREHDLRADDHTLAALLGRNRLLIAITAVAAIVVGAIVALASAEWWTLFIPVGVHALGTLAVGFMVVQMTTQPEAPDPAVAAKLADAGVPAPERTFNDLVEEFGGGTEARGATEVVATGHNENDIEPERAPAAATARQRTAMTPSQRPTEAAGGGSAIMAVEWGAVVGAVVLALVIAIAGGGLWWLLAGIMVVTGGAWVAYQVLARRGADHRQEREAGDTDDARRRMVRIAVGSVVAIELVAAVVVILGTAGGQ
jgi:Flp pilus assembly protein TadB